MSKNEVCVISAPTVKRLLRDIKELKKNPLTDHGIYYKHSEDDMLKGNALIVGPKDTPYQYGFYLFELTFPQDYPHTPPRVTFLTNDGTVRFNPNLYQNGKVCLSILNTWRGDTWTGCQTISTILLTLVTVLHSMPLINEPGYNEEHPDNKPYNMIVAYKNFDVAIIKAFTMFKNSVFYDELNEEFIKNYDQIIECLDKEEEARLSVEEQPLTTRVYRMTVNTNYKMVRSNLEKLYKKIKN